MRQTGCGGTTARIPRGAFDLAVVARAYRDELLALWSIFFGQ